MTENEKIELFDKWYDENYDEWAEGEEGIALREELEQAFKSGIAELEKENTELKEKLEMGIALKDEEIGCIQTDFNTFKSKAKELLVKWVELFEPKGGNIPPTPIQVDTEQFLSEVEK